MNLDGYEKFLELRKWFMGKLDEVDFSLGCKSYERTFEITLAYPNYFESESPFEESPKVMLQLHCYVIGPNRHYIWKGNSLEEAVNKARSDIESWDD